MMECDIYSLFHAADSEIAFTFITATDRTRYVLRRLQYIFLCHPLIHCSSYSCSVLTSRVHFLSPTIRWRLVMVYPSQLSKACHESHWTQTKAGHCWSRSIQVPSVPYSFKGSVVLTKTVIISRFVARLGKSCPQMCTETTTSRTSMTIEGQDTAFPAR